MTTKIIIRIILKFKLCSMIARIELRTSSRNSNHPGIFSLRILVNNFEGRCQLWALHYGSICSGKGRYSYKTLLDDQLGTFSGIFSKIGPRYIVVLRTYTWNCCTDARRGNLHRYYMVLWDQFPVVWNHNKTSFQEHISMFFHLFGSKTYLPFPRNCHTSLLRQKRNKLQVLQPSVKPEYVLKNYASMYILVI